MPFNTRDIQNDGIVNRIQSSVSRSPSMAIIAICVLSFLLELIPGIGPFYLYNFQFDPDFLLTKPWTLVTYIFLHKSLGHLFFNMLVLYFFGPVLERRAGNKELLGIFFTSGILSAVGHALISLPIFGIYPSPIIGASGAIYGVFAALAVLEPNLRVYVYFIPMRLKEALVLFALFDFLLMNSTDMIAHAAHLSGLFVGLYMGFRIKTLQNKYRRAYVRW